MKTKQIIFVAGLVITAFASCKKEGEELQSQLPTVTNVEVGLNNNETGTIGKDFHFNADVLAGGKIENVKISILPKTGENYAKVWQYELTWESFQGAKNASVHKHFNIPADAAEGKYDFLITITDQNGTKLKIRRSITLYLEANLPVNPRVSILNLFVNDSRFYRDGQFTSTGAHLKQGDLLQSQVTISGVKGDGKMYILLINAGEKHRPETIDQIDFNKAIVYDVLSHQNWLTNEHFSNVIVDPVTFQMVRNYPNLVIGNAFDNNQPVVNPSSGAKAWKSGTYYFGVIYQNNSYNISHSHYLEVPVDID